MGDHRIAAKDSPCGKFVPNVVHPTLPVTNALSPSALLLSSTNIDALCLVVVVVVVVVAAAVAVAAVAVAAAVAVVLPC